MLPRRIFKMKHSQQIHLMVDPLRSGCFSERVYESQTGDLSHKFRSEKSLFGYKPSVLKSGIQKYARRSEIQKGLWCLVEMDLFSLLEWEGTALGAYLRKYPKAERIKVQTQAQKIRTNMVNRLVVMMSEEVSISAWWMPLLIHELYQKWLETRGGPESRKYLVDMYLHLTSQKMVRLISDIHSVYLVPPGYVKLKQMEDLIRIHQGIQIRYPAIYRDQTEIGEVEWSVDVDAYPSAVQQCVNGIIYNIERGSDHAFFWIKRLFDLEKECKTPRGRYVKIIWKILLRFIDRNTRYEFARKAVCALETFYKRMNHREKPIYLYHAVLLMVRRNEIDWQLQTPAIDTPMVEVDKLYADHLRNGKMEMDGYVMDLHTRKMKWNPGSLARFAREGAYVKNEDVRFVNPDYRAIYLLLKQELDRYFSKRRKKMIPINLRAIAQHAGVPIVQLKAENVAKIQASPQAQLRTARYKKAVYLVGKFVFKGPYKAHETSLINNLRHSYAIGLLENALELCEWERGSIPFEFLGFTGDDQYYLAAANVGRQKDIPFDVVSSKIEMNVKIVRRKDSVDRVSDVEGTERLTEDIKLAALQHLYLRFLLDVGDSGTHNILIRKDYLTSGRLISGIDLEEKRGVKKNGSRLEHLFKKPPSRRQVQLYEADVCRIKSFSDGHLDEQTLGRLRDAGIDLGRLSENMELWEGLN
jgi:hypothetical protein